MKTLYGENDAMDSVSEGMRHIEGGEWMVLVCHLDDDRVVLHRTTWHFPKAKFLQAISLITKSLADEPGVLATPQLPDTPLPRVFNTLNKLPPDLGNVVDSTIPEDEDVDDADDGGDNDV